MDLTFLKPLYAGSGPFSSLYLDLTRTTEDAAKAAELRWRARRGELAAQGAPEGDLRALEAVVEEDLRDRRSEGLVAFAAGGKVGYVRRMNRPPRAEHARCAPLPHVLPLLAELGERFPYLIVRVDRRGGTITCATSDASPDAPPRTIDVPGDEDFPLRKPKGGDWNQSRFQRAAEEAWKANARKVGRRIEAVARRHGAELVILAGDPHARSAVMEELGENLLTHTVETDRGPDGAAMDAEVGRILELKRAERIMRVAERFERELAAGRRAVTGLPATAEAAFGGRVESLLLDEDPAAPTRLWVGPRPHEIAATPERLRELGVAEPAEERADAALIRAVAATDGDLTIIPAITPQAELGVGAVLRY
ncbi:Vms1/Ankzf1 family peptidyl-tRNA hydrolase [Actinomadura oligospora]|uniref:baeRF2 domain-containing protein n=1 Tax=Actinomadura oligospora TaxID=111804 RepID=UPI0004793676|nr:Vms1/Ankzf1 family peptidyl-tRNA hydrolase [Actinomadura oligospora]